MTRGKIKEKNQSKNDKKIEIKIIRMKLKKNSNDTLIVWW